MTYYVINTKVHDQQLDKLSVFYVQSAKPRETFWVGENAKQNKSKKQNKNKNKNKTKPQNKKKNQNKKTKKGTKSKTLEVASYSLGTAPLSVFCFSFCFCF